MNNEVFAFRAYIKKILIEVPDYKFEHTTLSGSNNLFIGRRDVIDYLLNILKNGVNKGSYLITGYRGMGKTSMVNAVLKKYRETKEGENTQVIKISFGQKDIQESDVVNQIVSELKNILDQHGTVQGTKFIAQFSSWIFVTSLLMIGYFSGDFWKNNIYHLNFFEYISERTVGQYLLGFLLVGTGVYLLQRIVAWWRYNCYKPMLHKAWSRVNKLYEMCISEISDETGTTGAFFDNLISFSKKKNRRYYKVSTKEISNEIIAILELIEKSKLCQIVFIFDELDKIDTTGNKVTYYEDMESFSAKKGDGLSGLDHRERKIKVLDILASLKYLTTEGSARFIFIAGSEMFDAAMADVSDRQSALSSVFNQIINVDSLLKDKSESTFVGVGITNMVEEYLAKLLIPDYKGKEPFLRAYYKYLCEISDSNSGLNLASEDIYKVVYSLQHFIIYVTYRSNGSPKKMVRIIEDHMRPSRDGEKLCGSNKSIIVLSRGLANNKKEDKVGTFLSLSYNDQYKIGLLSYIFRPIIISKSRTFKQYSDSLLVATPYLMDHLLKFHSFAFSLEHLELLPEVLSANRSPELRFFLEEMVYWLKQNMIRDTENGFFEFKFYHKVFYEIAYVSKIFEEESAAFNFTLDENYSVKLHLRVKIKELRSIYKDFGGSVSGAAISSISFLNTMLGDAHYYDQEYSDAIVSYADALRMIHYMKDAPAGTDAINISLNPNKLAYQPTQYYYSMSVKCMLKLGLVYEKMKSYDIALSYYFDALRTASEVFLNDKSDKFPQIFLNGHKNTVINIVFSALYLMEKFPSRNVGDLEGFEVVLAKINEDKWMENHPDLLFNLSKFCFYEGMVNHAPVSEMILQIVGIKLIYTPKPAKKSYEYQNDRAAQLAYRALLCTLHETRVLETTDTVSYIILNNKNLFKVLLLAYERLIKDKQGYEWQAETYSKIGKIISTIGDIIYSFYNDGENEENKKSLPLIFENIEPKAKTSKEKTPKEQKGNTQDASSEANSGKMNNIEAWLSNINDEKDDIVKGFFINDKLDTRGLVFLNYILGAVLLHKSNEHNLAFINYNNILGIIRSSAKNLKYSEEKNKKIIEFLKNCIVSRMLEIASWSSGSSDRPQIYKYKQYFGVDDIHHPKYMSKYNYTNVSNAAEFKDALNHFAAIKVIFDYQGQIKELSDFDKIAEQALVSPVNGVFTQFSRLSELGLQCNINTTLLNQIYVESQDFDISLEIDGEMETKNLFKLWKKRFYQTSKSHSKTSIDENDLSQYIKQIRELSNLSIKNKQRLEEFPALIANWIFCLHNILNIMKMMGESFLYTNSNLGDYHRRYADVLKYYELCKWLEAKKIISEPVIDQLLQDLVGFKPMGNVDSTSQYQLSGRHYYKAIRTHNRGEEYRQMMTNLYFLEDDFSDANYIFSIAFERQRIRSGQIKGFINNIRDEVGTSQLFSYESYVNVEKIPIGKVDNSIVPFGKANT